MRTSEQISALADALSKAQAEMTGAKKDKANSFFKSDYADLSAVIEARSVPFANHGLSFVQSPGFVDGMICVTTRIMHSSGEWIEGDCILPPTKADAQGYGSAITYAKRYGLQAMCGIPSVDDDGNDAVKHKAEIQEIDVIGLKEWLHEEAGKGTEALKKAWESLSVHEKREAGGADLLTKLKKIAGGS